MHINIIGAGVVGVTTALRLAEAGHQVEVFEAGPSQAEGASFANAGLISPGHCFSWAEPGAISGFLRTMIGGGDGLGVTRPFDPALWRWGVQFATHCTDSQWAADSRASLALSTYSRDLHFNQPLLPLSAYGGATNGILYLHGPQHKVPEIEGHMLDQAGERYQVLDAKQITALEPGLEASQQRFETGIFCPGDATGNAFEFTTSALARAEELGAKFHFQQRVVAFEQSHGRVISMRTESGLAKADAYVLAAGLASARLVAPLGYKLPIYPVTGYSLTYEHDGDMQPRVGAVSIADKIAWAGFGDRTIRFTGFADIGPPGSKVRTEARFASLEKFSTSIFPGLHKFRPKRWVGQRPMTPDCIPILGRGRQSNLFFNCGHGAMGWTMSSGSAQIISDLIAGRETAIDCTAYRWDRFQ